MKKRTKFKDFFAQNTGDKLLNQRLNMAKNFTRKSDDAKICTVELVQKIIKNKKLLYSRSLGGKKFLPINFRNRLNPKNDISIAKPNTWALNDKMWLRRRRLRMSLEIMPFRCISLLCLLMK